MLALSSQLRAKGLQAHAEQLSSIGRLLDPPELRGVLVEIVAPSAWVTRERAGRLAERLAVAAELISEMLDDAAITGNAQSEARGRAWLETIGFSRGRRDPHSKSAIRGGVSIERFLRNAT